MVRSYLPKVHPLGLIPWNYMKKFRIYLHACILLGRKESKLSLNPPLRICDLKIGQQTITAEPHVSWDLIKLAFMKDLGILILSSQKPIYSLLLIFFFLNFHKLFSFPFFPFNPSCFCFNTSTHRRFWLFDLELGQVGRDLITVFKVIQKI